MCTTCGFVDYMNPRIVVGSVVVEGQLDAERILLCPQSDRPPEGLLEPYRRASWRPGRPRKSRPAEKPGRRQGANSTWRASLAIYDLTHVAQVQLMFLDPTAGISLFSRNREPGSRL